MAWPTVSARSKNWGTEILTDADLEAQLDLLHTYFNDSLNGTTGHGHTGGTNDGPKITLTAAAGIQGTLPLANGGTGQTSLAALGNLFYPVGSIYINYSDSTNPGTLLGFGTWVAIADRMLLGLGSTFTTVSGTGGASTVTLSKGNIPAHVHTQTSTGAAGSGSSGGDSGTGINTGNGVADGLKVSPDAVTIMNPYQICYIWRRSV